jgi:hypothetical protein
MKRAWILGLGFAVMATGLGCRADVEETPDSTRVEVEGPDVDVGEAPVDLDPSTDDDIDVDTPAAGDK